MTEPYKTYLLAAVFYFASLFFPAVGFADCLSVTDLDNGDCVGYIGAIQSLDLGGNSLTTTGLFNVGGDISFTGQSLNITSTDSNNAGLSLYVGDYMFPVVWESDYNLSFPNAGGANPNAEDDWNVLVVAPRTPTVDLSTCENLRIDSQYRLYCGAAASSTVSAQINILEAQAQENLAHGVYIFFLTMAFMVFFFKRGV